MSSAPVCICYPKYFLVQGSSTHFFSPPVSPDSLDPVRWIRPEFQNPAGAKPPAQVTVIKDEEVAATTGTAKKKTVAPWPKRLSKALPPSASPSPFRQTLAMFGGPLPARLDA